MFHYKSYNRSSLDHLINQHFKGKTLKEDRFLYVWDSCTGRKHKPTDFYDPKCNSTNTWNYDLKFEDTEKRTIMKKSLNYGFNDYSTIPEGDTHCVVKGSSHIYTLTMKYGQAKLIDIVTKNELEKSEENRKGYVFQPVLKNNEGEELNVFVLRDLKTREINFTGIVVKHDPSKQMNRKFNKCDYTHLTDTSKVVEYFGKDNLVNFKRYCEDIKIDYGRAEFINDKDRGWCMIDLNDSPGSGEITNIYFRIIKPVLQEQLM